MSLMDIFFSKNKNDHSIGITPDKETQRILIKQEKEIMETFILQLNESGRYDAMKIKKLLEKNKSAIFKSITDGDSLTLEEKRQKNLNTRLKYGTNYIDSLTVHGLTDDASIEFFKNTYYQISGIISRKYQIERLKSSGITKCRISSSHDERDCAAIKKHEKQVYDIDNVPELPLKECDASYCRCIIVAVLD